MQHNQNKTVDRIFEAGVRRYGESFCSNGFEKLTKHQQDMLGGKASFLRLGIHWYKTQRDKLNREIENLGNK